MTLFVLCVFVFLTALIGASLGSFLNVVIWRVPEKASLMSPPSHCPKCGALVRWYDNIPILSWFILRGRCRDCREPISFRYPLVEALVGFVALIVSVSIFFGGWSGMKSQCLRWDEFASSFEAWRPLLNNEFKGVPQDSNLEYDIMSLILDDFVRLLFMSVGLSIYVALLSSVELALGFIRFDQKRSPRSLLVASTIVVLLAIPTILWLNTSNPALQTKSIIVFFLSVFLSAIPVFLVKYNERFEFVILSSAWGVVSGAILAPFGSLLCLAIASGIRKKTGRNVLGIVFYVATTTLLAVELIVSLID